MQIKYWPPKMDNGSYPSARLFDAIDVSILFDEDACKASIFASLADGREIEFYGNEVPDITDWERCVDQGGLLIVPSNMKIRAIKSAEQVLEEHKNTDVRDFERSDFTFDESYPDRFDGYFS